MSAGTRGYRSPLREQRAAETRRRVVEAAGDVFSARGYSGATVAAIAAAAGVSVDTVVTVGSKASLLLEAFRTRYAGEGGWSSIFDDQVAADAFTVSDPEEAVDWLATYLVRAHRLSADLWLAIRVAAAVEPAVAEGFAELNLFKAESFEATTRWLLRIGLLEPVAEADVTALTAELNLVLSAETYLQLVRDYHFTDDDYVAWLRRRLHQVRL